MLMIGADFADHLLGGRPAVHGAGRKIAWNLVNHMVAWTFAALPRDNRLRLHDKAVQEITGANPWKPHIRIIRRGDAACPKPCCSLCPTEQNGTLCARLRRGGRLPDPFFWSTDSEIEKFCLGVNSVTPKPCVSISFVSTQSDLQSSKVNKRSNVPPDARRAWSRRGGLERLVWFGLVWFGGLFLIKRESRAPSKGLRLFFW